MVNTLLMINIHYSLGHTVTGKGRQLKIASVFFVLYIQKNKFKTEKKTKNVIIPARLGFFFITGFSYCVRLLMWLHRIQ